MRFFLCNSRWDNSAKSYGTLKVNSMWPCDIRDIDQHWFRWWLGARWHQAITWTNVDLPSTRSSASHSKVMFTWILKISNPQICLKFTHFKSHSRPRGDNELRNSMIRLNYCMSKTMTISDWQPGYTNQSYLQTFWFVLLNFVNFSSTHISLRESILRLLNEETTAMTGCCAPACSQALPVKPQGVWARGIEAWSRSGHVTSETGVAEVAVFGALQPNVLLGFFTITSHSHLDIIFLLNIIFIPITIYRLILLSR